MPTGSDFQSLLSRAPFSHTEYTYFAIKYATYPPAANPPSTSVHAAIRAQIGSGSFLVDLWTAKQIRGSASPANPTITEAEAAASNSPAMHRIEISPRNGCAEGQYIAGSIPQK
jgi:hypothetical protein